MPFKDHDSRYPVFSDKKTDGDGTRVDLSHSGAHMYVQGVKIGSVDDPYGHYADEPGPSKKEEARARAKQTRLASKGSSMQSGGSLLHVSPRRSKHKGKGSYKIT